MRWIFSHCSQSLFSENKEKLRSCFCYFLSRFCEENFGNIFTQAYVQTCSRVSKLLQKYLKLFILDQDTKSFLLGT